MKTVVMEILYWILTAIKWILTAIKWIVVAVIVFGLYLAVKEEIRHRESVERLRIEYREAVNNNLTVKR